MIRILALYDASGGGLWRAGLASSTEGCEVRGGSDGEMRKELSTVKGLRCCGGNGSLDGAERQAEE